MTGQSKHILIIDDDVTALDIVSYVFEEKGYKVERCADGHSAIEYSKRVRPDLILVDLMMPEINGIETVRRIRGLGLTETPIVAFTAVDDHELHQEAMDAGCNEVVTKPCPTEKLLRVINARLGLEC